jgi:hypothetical protein
VRVVVWCVVLVIVVGGAVWGGVALYRHKVYGAVFSDSQLSGAVAVGERFSLAVPDRGPSVGDSWSATAGAGELVTARGQRTLHKAPIDRVRAPLPGGGQGTTFFLYDAKAAGTATITLSNCFQGCDQPTPSSETRNVTWTITVR